VIARQRALDIIKNFQAEYAGGEQLFVKRGGAMINVTVLSDIELADVANYCVGVMKDLAMQEKKGATIQ
jgi:hypothetical protein